MERSCVLCRLPLQTTEKYFCSSCNELFLGEHLCERCGLSTSNTCSVCEKCRYNPPIWNQLNCICGYHFPIDILIQRFKYQQQTWLLKPLIELLVPNIHTKPEVLIPVPMHRERQFKRGYNQSNLLALELGKVLGINVDTSAVIRHKVTHPQQGLTAKERERNLHGAFKIEAHLSYKHIALIDDVVTTGATVNEITQLLYAHNVERVDIICLSRTIY